MWDAYPTSFQPISSDLLLRARDATLRIEEVYRRLLMHCDLLSAVFNVPYDHRPLQNLLGNIRIAPTDGIGKRLS